MNTSTVTSRALNQDVSRAKKAADGGPVIITDRGKPSHVLMTYADYPPPERVGPAASGQALPCRACRTSTSTRRAARITARRRRSRLSYLLDTNVVSELRKVGDGKADRNVAAWVETEDAANFFISAITILELERGVLGILRRDR